MQQSEALLAESRVINLEDSQGEGGGEKEGSRAAKRARKGPEAVVDLT